MVVCNVAEITPEERQTLEHLLGQPLQENQQVRISVATPPAPPDEATRRDVLRRLEEHFAAADRYAAEHGITAEEADAAVEEAMRHVRYGGS